MVSLNAAILDYSKSVVVMPLLFSYQVKQDYKISYAKAESTLKGYAKEKSSSSYNANYGGGYYSANANSSSSRNLDGKYDLKATSEYESTSYNDTVIVEKSLNTEKFTGILESALSEAGILVGSREKQSSKNYILTGDVVSARMGKIRVVPDGTQRRYSVGSTLKISIKITDAKTGIATFAKTFTGNGTKTFDAVDYIPAEETMDIATDEIAAQLVAALTGQRFISRSESDDEYQDSPGKRLID